MAADLGASLRFAGLLFGRGFGAGECTLGLLDPDCNLTWVINDERLGEEAADRGFRCGDGEGETGGERSGWNVHPSNSDRAFFCSSSFCFFETPDVSASRSHIGTPLFEASTFVLAGLFLGTEGLKVQGSNSCLCLIISDSSLRWFLTCASALSRSQMEVFFSDE